MKIKITLGKHKVRANEGHDAWVLVRLMAPVQPANARRPPLSIVPCVDVSGSMEGAKLTAVKDALARLVEHLVPGDSVGLVSFSEEGRVIVPVTEVSQQSRHHLHAAVQRLATEGSTNLADGLLKGCQALTQAGSANSRSRLVLLTDGQANCGVATSGAELRALVKRELGTLSLSAFGFGTDCDHSVLGELAEEGGGSFAFIQNEDGVLTAFARELGGLVSTYASDVRIRMVPLAGAAVEERVGDVLYQAEFPWCVPLALLQHAEGQNVEVAHVEVKYRDAAGSEQELRVPVLVDYVKGGSEDRQLDPQVQRARDERLLSQAQTTAEGHAGKGDYVAAQRALSRVVAQLATPELVSFAQEVLLPSYEHRMAYIDASPMRASADKALKKRRMLYAEQVVATRLAPISASAAEVAMEASFRKKKRQ
jgi:uncharacterized protein YegL